MKYSKHIKVVKEGGVDNKTMAVFSIIKKSGLEGAKRLDAEYYQPEYLEVARKLKDAQTLRVLASDIRYGLYVEPDYLDKGINFIRAMNTTNFWIDGEILKIADKKVPSDYFLKTGDCLIVRSGANTGLVSVIYPRLEKSTFGSYTIRIRFNKINPFFASIFLNTKYGLLQTQRSQTGAAQPNLNIPNLKEIKIPIIQENQQEEIEKWCLEIEQARAQSGQLYSQAENLMLEELGLKDFKEEQSLYSVVNFSKLKEVGRMDAEYFQPKYAELESRIRKYESRALEEVLENVPAKFDTAKQQDKQFRYVELSNINASIGIIDGFSEVLGKDAPSRAKRVLKEGDVIVSSVEGSLEKVALVNEEQKDFLASTGFFQFRSEEILPEVLLVLAKSIVFQWQLEKRCAGTILTAVPKESINDILIPVLPKPIQQKIAELVRKSHEARKKAKELLEEAKRKVEELIEKEK